MNINIKATNIDMSPAVNDYVNKKVQMLEKFFKEEAGEVLILVEVGKSSLRHRSGDIFRAEMKVRTNGKEFYAAAEKDDLYAAIDEVKDEIVHEMTSRRKKAIRMFRKGSARIKEMIKNINLRPWRR